MTTDQTQSLKDQITSLIAEAEEVNKKNAEENKEAKVKFQEIKARADASLDQAKNIFTELDKADKDAGDALDALVLGMVADEGEE